jgi:hypothetical protein
MDYKESWKALVINVSLFQAIPSRKRVRQLFTYTDYITDFILQTWVIMTIRRTILEDIWGGARRGLLRSSSLSQEGGVLQLALRGT